MGTLLLFVFLVGLSTLFLLVALGFMYNINFSEALRHQNFKLGLTVLVGLGLLFSAVYTVKQGERAIILRFGQVHTVSEPGLHFKAPLVDAVQRMSVRTEIARERQTIYSKDVQPVQIGFSVNFSIKPDSVSDVYVQYGQDYRDKLLRPQIRARFKEVLGQYTVVEIIGSREEIIRQIHESLEKTFLDRGFRIESIQIENLTFPRQLERTAPGEPNPGLLRGGD
jgi:regulator of protease activity HflC (stomatin/prohibitin superfamily)